MDTTTKTIRTSTTESPQHTSPHQPQRRRRVGRIVGGIAIATATLGACTADKSASPVEASSLDAPATESGEAVITQNNDGAAKVRAQATGTTTNAGVRVGTINVNGFGKKGQAPDQVTITMGIETNGPNAAEALKDNNAKAAALIKLLKDSGVEDRFIQTSQLSIYPRFDDKGQKITGYQVSNIVTATLKDLKASGKVIDAAASAAGDAIRVQGLSFGLSDTSEAAKVARERAVADAKLQAEQLAAAAGVKLGKLVSISTANIGVPSPVFQQVEAKAVAADSAVPLEGGSQDVTAQVVMVWEIAE